MKGRPIVAANPLCVPRFQQAPRRASPNLDPDAETAAVSAGQLHRPTRSPPRPARFAPPHANDCSSLHTTNMDVLVSREAGCRERPPDRHTEDASQFVDPILHPLAPMLEGTTRQPIRTAEKGAAHAARRSEKCRANRVVPESSGGRSWHPSSTSPKLMSVGKRRQFL